VRIDGTLGTAVGWIGGLEQSLQVHLRSGRRRRYALPLTTDGHGGGEAPLLDDVVEALRQDRAPVTAVEDCLDGYRLTFAALQSAASGEVVAVAAPDGS
jgi:predicted dehydrogenase